MNYTQGVVGIVQSEITFHEACFLAIGGKDHAKSVVLTSGGNSPRKTLRACGRLVRWALAAEVVRIL